MPVLINFKICDNSEDCGGIAACPVKAFYWNAKNKTVAIDETKCTLCGKCENACPIDAIKVAKNEKEFVKFKKEIDKDPRKASDLFIDRYGAQPIHPDFTVAEEKFGSRFLKSSKLTVVEAFNRESINCLLRSIPIKELFNDADIKYLKVEVKSGAFLKEYGVKQLPSLLFFKDEKVIGKIEGYYDIGKKDEITEKINELIVGLNRTD